MDAKKNQNQPSSASGKLVFLFFAQEISLF